MRTMMMILGSAVVLGLVAAFGRLPQRAEPAAAATASGGELDAELQQLRAQTAMLSAEVATLKRQPGQLQAVARAAAEEGDARDEAEVHGEPVAVLPPLVATEDRHPGPRRNAVDRDGQCQHPRLRLVRVNELERDEREEQEDGRPES